MTRVRQGLRDSPYGFGLFVAFLVGRIPVHAFRILVYRAVFRVKIGHNSTIHWRTAFFDPWGVKIGNNTIIGNDCFLDGRRELRIGNNVNVGGHVQFFTLEHDPNAVDFGVAGGPITVGDYAYVATRATILPGVTIGEGAVVAAGAVVTRDVPPYTVVGGVPARHIKDRRRDLNYELNYHLPFQ